MDLADRDLLSHRVLFLSEPISADVAKVIVSRLLLLDARSPRERIDLYINSPGGSITDGLAIIDAIRCIRAPVSTICIGQAASMAAWILACGARGQRYATPNAEIMIHQAAGKVSGQTDDIRVGAKRIIDLQNKLVKMLSEYTGNQESKISRDMEREYFMNAEEAKAYGIVDEVLETTSKKRRKGKA